ncbi:MAG: alpha/beta hydrolase family protein [Nocardioides sp.]
MAARTRRVRLTRRGVLAASAVSGLLVGCGELPNQSTPRTAPSPHPAAEGSRRIHYGEDHGSQFVDLRLPARRPRGTVVLLHGGYWYPEHGLELMYSMATALTGLGFATWNVEYRRTGAGGGFPNTLSDVATAVDRLSDEDLPDGLADNVVLLGHSAGGHLAVWAASRDDRTPGGTPKVRARGAISLAGVLDLMRAGGASRSAEPVSAFMGGSPTEAPEDYALADPARLVPAGCPVWAVHAEADGTVPPEQSTSYVALAEAAGATVRRVVVPGDHLAVIDPDAPCFPTIRDLVVEASA